MVMTKKAGKKTKEIAEFIGVSRKTEWRGIKEHIIQEKKVLETDFSKMRESNSFSLPMLIKISSER